LSWSPIVSKEQNFAISSFEPDVVLYSVSVILLPTQKLFCLQVFHQAGPLQQVDYLAPRWETALSVFPKDTATCYHIRSRTEVLQPFDY